MHNPKAELIGAIVSALKIDQNPFNIATLADYIDTVAESDYQNFYKALFGTDHAYLNGLDRVAKVSEQFSPTLVDDVAERAKFLISKVEAINSQISKDAERMGEDFVGLCRKATVSAMTPETKNILDSVKPYRDHKELIINIHHYQTSKIAQEAFEYAIRYGQSAVMIESGKVAKMVELRK